MYALQTAEAQVIVNSFEVLFLVLKRKKKTIKTAEHAILEHPDSSGPGRLLRRPAKQRQGLESAG